MIDEVHECNEIVPSNGSFNSYSNVRNCSCQSCDKSCLAPNVNGDIGFFDGFDGKVVGIVYGALVAFSIIFQVLKYYYFNKRNAKDLEFEDENNSS